MRMGPARREAVWQRSDPQEPRLPHFIVAPRTHAGPRQELCGDDSMVAYERAGPVPVPMRTEIGHRNGRLQTYGLGAERAQYEAIDEIDDKDDITILNISGTRAAPAVLQEGLGNPEWFLPSPRWSKSCAAPSRRATSRALRFSSPVSPLGKVDESANALTPGSN